MSANAPEIEDVVGKEYQHGFVTDIDSDTLPPGLDADVVRAISAKKGEPEWMIERRLDALDLVGTDRTELGQRRPPAD